VIHEVGEWEESSGKIQPSKIYNWPKEKGWFKGMGNEGKDKIGST